MITFVITGLILLISALMMVFLFGASLATAPVMTVIFVYVWFKLCWPRKAKHAPSSMDEGWEK